MLYVYAFVAESGVAPESAGIDDAALRLQPLSDGLAAVVSEHEAPVEASDAAVLAHARAVEAVATANDAVLPARFGAIHVDEAALREAVAERTDLRAALERVRGCVELGLRVFVEAADPTPAPSGTVYMRARLEQRRELERLATRLHEPLASLARDSTLTVGATPRLLLTSAYLVERERVEAFRETLTTLEAQHPQVGAVCTGPWPPYSFAIAGGGT